MKIIIIKQVTNIKDNNEIKITISQTVYVRSTQVTPFCIPLT